MADQALGLSADIEVVRITANLGKTVNRFVVAQGAAGTTQIAAASASNKHKIMFAVLTMSATGTLKFTDGAGDLTGAMDVAAQGGFVIPFTYPFFMVETSIVNTTLNIVTTGGNAKGLVVYVTEP